jgi:hypothetical protein
MALTLIEEVRVSVGDIDTTLPILDDNTYDYFLTKNGNSVRRASLDAARSILLLLSMRTDETVDIFTVKGSKSAEQYRLALQMFLRDPSLNPVLTSANGYAGGISKSDMQANLNTLDNNSVITPGMEIFKTPTDAFSV